MDSIKNRLLCYLFGHHYYTIRKITPNIRELGCKRCSKLFAIHFGLGAILPLDNEIKALNEKLLQDEAQSPSLLRD